MGGQPVQALPLQAPLQQAKGFPYQSASAGNLRQMARKGIPKPLLHMQSLEVSWGLLLALPPAQPRACGGSAQEYP